MLEVEMLEVEMDVSAAARALKRGEIVGVPTDTVYGIAVDPFDEAALDRLYDLKGREVGKPIAILVASLDQGLLLGAMSDRALELADKYWPGPVTLVVPRLDTAPPWLGDPARRTIGLRCPDHPVALALLEMVGPLAVTSANTALNEPAQSAEEAREVFGDEILTFLPGDVGGGLPSTLVDLTRPAETVLRKGPISF
ncbi:MAG: L-threonylcarbamoyladenylate synthase [Acidimicrobiia bacterium]|nr:L-threonylcarbamoyladenylate synthase [Acidimicrobiia bacterium]